MTKEKTSRTFTSYAQLGEDTRLFNALKHVENGFYIDVGAQDPVEHSVTKAFYELGWRGINIDPVKHWYNRLVDDRPEDINLNVAVGAEKGTLKFFEFPKTGLSTGNDKHAKRHIEGGFYFNEIEVEVVTLNEICSKHVAGEIHFLKVDVEGLEKEVFQSIDFSKYTPWIIVAEATEPLSQVESFAEWEPLLLDAGYSYVSTDGLNRFYLSPKHNNLREFICG